MLRWSLPYVSKAVFTLISAALALSALTLILFHFWDVVQAIISRENVESSLIEAVEYVVIGLAIFDVSRFVLEEEVLTDRVKFSPAATRNKISRFMVVIIIAVALESLLKILSSQTLGREAIGLSVLLLVVDAILLVGLGVYLKLSVQSEIAIREK
jgi:hypothetical protein